MSRVELAKVRSLTFYHDELTAARRTKRIPQLVCVGRACKHYTPEAVHCENIGSSGADGPDWKVRLLRCNGCFSSIFQTVYSGFTQLSATRKSRGMSIS